MKKLDLWLQNYRSRLVLKELPPESVKLFDIGCSDGRFLNQVQKSGRLLYGCDPKPKKGLWATPVSFYSGYFPDCVLSEPSLLNETFDVVTALAVFEHFSDDALTRSSDALSAMLGKGGRIIATVPSPFVDVLLHVLITLKLIEGQEAHEHHGFRPRDLIRVFERNFDCLVHKKFQLGLNNLFIFVKK